MRGPLVTPMSGQAYENTAEKRASLHKCGLRILREKERVYINVGLEYQERTYTNVDSDRILRERDDINVGSEY